MFSFVDARGMSVNSSVVSGKFSYLLFKVISNQLLSGEIAKLFA